jgi:uncharacterized membrane protein YdjX (TVP38/TMEM64 family)
MKLPGQERPGGLRAAAIRFSVFVAVVLGGLALVRFTPLRENLDPARLRIALDLIRNAWWAPLALIAGYAVSAVLALPITPLLIASAWLFGIALGSLYSMLGCMVGATLGYLFAAHLGRGFVQQVLGERLVKVEAMLGPQTFWTLVRARWLPIPFPVFNFAAALVGVPIGPFLASSAVGLLIPVTLNTFVWAGLVEATGAERTEQLGKFAFFMVALFALSLLPGWLAKRKAARDQSPPPGLE